MLDLGVIHQPRQERIAEGKMEVGLGIHGEPVMDASRDPISHTPYSHYRWVWASTASLGR